MHYKAAIAPALPVRMRNNNLAAPAQVPSLPGAYRTTDELANAPALTAGAIANLSIVWH